MSKLGVWVCICLVTAMAMPAKALDYRLPDPSGQVQSLQQYRGQWLVVNYWASWCTTCLKELPDLIALHEQHQQGGIAVVGINFETISPARVRAFIDGHNIPYPILLSEPVPVTPLGRVPALPTTYILDPQGRVVAGQVGLVSRQAIEDYIASRRHLSH